MKILCLSSFMAVWFSGVGAATNSNAQLAVFRPLKIPYETLVKEDLTMGDSSSPLLDALRSVGMISVTNMPNSFRSLKRETLAWMEACASVSAATKEHVFSDGTRRRTMATHTIPGVGGIQTLDHGMNVEAGDACDSFDKASMKFREQVDSATRAFANHVSFLLGEDDASEPLLKAQDGFEFKTLHDVVENGEHLEHFHCYEKDKDQSASFHSEDSTIEWHTDQGLFLVFTPGVMAYRGSQNGKRDLLDETDGFYIQLADGAQSLVQFDSQDDLVLMLGDGVNQLANQPNLKLRAVPHALYMPTHGDNETRLWYGRMVLPPATAVHPKHGKTFGVLREKLIEASLSDVFKSEDVLALGCSSPSMRARQLEESSCEEGTLLCWHRCMSLEEFKVSDGICGDQGLDLRCINPRSQLWDNTHGDWFPGCIDASTAEIGTPYPTLPDYPRDEELCTDASYDTFVQTAASGYDHMANLTNGGVLMWSVEGENINGMLSYNGLFGYIAMGFTGPPSAPHVMNGAIIMMGTPSESYSPVTGFNFSFDPTVEEYIIDPHEKTFRLWMTPVSAMARSASDVDSYAVQETDCFTALTFNTPGIFNTTFNVSGKDDIIWAANGVDMFAGYHGSSRGRIMVEWATGDVNLDVKSEVSTTDDQDDDEGEPEGSVGSTSSALPITIFFATSLAGAVLPLMHW